MKTRILGFSGRIASGKTTISQVVATKLRWRWFGFGEFLRFEANRMGLDSSNRFVLKQLGKEAIKEGWEKFCSNVLRTAEWQPGEGLVLDGIRHIEAVRTCQKLTYPSDIRLIFVSTEDAVRKSRLLNRGLVEDISRLDADSLETQVLGVLSAQSDLTVDGSLSPDDCALSVLKWLASLDAGQSRANDVVAQRLRESTR